MRALLSSLMLLALATPALAEPVPEPGSMSLVALGIAAAIWVGRRGRK